MLDNRSPFAMPRVNVAWDIDGNGNNVLRGGYGLFYNRNMGNVEYDPATQLPPASVRASIRTCIGGANYGGGVGLQLRHDPRGHAGHPRWGRATSSR